MKTTTTQKNLKKQREGRQTDRQTDRHRERQTERERDRQIDTETETERVQRGSREREGKNVCICPRLPPSLPPPRSLSFVTFPSGTHTKISLIA